MLSANHPTYITAAEQQAGPRTLRDSRTMYSHTVSSFSPSSPAKPFLVCNLHVICLFTLLVIRKFTPPPHHYSNGNMIKKENMKMFSFWPRIPSSLPHVTSGYPIHTCLLSADHPRILRPPDNRQDQGPYVTAEQCIHTPSRPFPPSSSVKPFLACNLLIYPISYKKMYPITIVMETRKERKYENVPF